MFKIIMEFVSGGIHTETHGEDTLIEALQRLTLGPAARCGVIAEVKVVDALDCVNFRSHWDGTKMKVTFPPNLTN